MGDETQSLTAALAGRYRVERELGRGGMARVYLAHDLKHGRDVALKVLRPELAASLGAERFLAEIRLTAKLQHAHIVPLFDSGEAGGFLYYVMPYVEGESLRVRLGREHRLDMDAVLALARPVAQALAYAHERGVVHRDIKPENILLSRGQPFVTDFGIARAVTTAGGEGVTATGLVIGTPAYMSPEQALGDAAVDARSDVYSLGCVIYELLVGEPPFTGPTVQALIAKRLTGPPPPLAGVPAAVGEVVRRALATAPQDRFATAVALADALVEAAGRPATPEQSIVVLPFENLSPDPDNAFFADGLTEELIADLSKVRALRVISRTSAMHYKATTRSLPAIAQELNVRHVLEGSVRRAGNNLRITAQLIDAATDTHLWAEKYTGTLDDVFDLQERLSRQIVDALKVTLAPEEDRRLSARPLPDVRALDCYLRAMQQVRTYTESGLDQALQLTTRALELVGERALLHATQALVHWQYHNAGIRLDENTLRTADACADRALELDGESSAGFLAKGLVAWTRGQLQDGARNLARAAELDGNSDALTFLSYIYSLADRPEPARACADQAIASDPLNPWAVAARPLCELLCGDLQTAVDRFREGVAVAPGDFASLLFLAMTLAYAGNKEEALVHFEQAAVKFPAYRSWMGMWMGALRVDRDAVCAEAADLQAYAARDREVSWSCAACFAAVGEHDEAIRWLANAVRLGFVNHRFFTTRDPFLAPLRTDPRFEALMDRAREQERAFRV